EAVYVGLLGGSNQPAAPRPGDRRVHSKAVSPKRFGPQGEKSARHLTPSCGADARVRTGLPGPAYLDKGRRGRRPQSRGPPHDELTSQNTSAGALLREPPPSARSAPRPRK